MGGSLAHQTVLPSGDRSLMVVPARLPARDADHRSEYLIVSFLRTYLAEMAAIGASGEATKETPYYPPLLNLLNGVGATLSPSVLCVLTPKNRGDGIPDGGLFVKRPAVVQAGEQALQTRAPERGVVEVKGLAASVKETASSQQVAKYLVVLW